MSRHVDDYLDAHHAERRHALAALRETIRGALRPGFVESMSWGMPTYEVPLDRYPHTHDRRPLGYVGFGSGAHGISLHLPHLRDAEARGRFAAAWRARTGRHPELGRGHVRFRHLADVPLDLVAEVVGSAGVDDVIARYEAGRAG